MKNKQKNNIKAPPAAERRENTTTLTSSLRLLSLDEQEKNIVDLIIASLENGIISNQSVSLEKEGYYKFKLNGDERSYTVCFGTNPDKNSYPSAERALRASEFVTRLLNIINSDYNCYVVPSHITPPTPDSIKKRLSGTYSYTVSYAFESESRLTDDCTRSFELEVIIIASMGNSYRRMNDNLAVEIKRGQNGQREASFSYRSIDHPASNINTNSVTSLVEKEAVNDILEVVNENSNKLKIFNCLADSPDSNFSRYLTELKNTGEDGVGQINLQPCSVFVCAVPEKEFVYDIREPGEKNGVKLTIIWNKEEDLDFGTSLFIVAKNGKLEGLSYRPHYTDEQGNVVSCPPLSPLDTVVPAMTVTPDHKSQLSAVTLIPPSGTDIDPEKGYHGVHNYGVYVGKCSSNYKKGYYLKNVTLQLRNEHYISEDCDTCDYSNTLWWKGDLIYDRNYITPYNTLRSGKLCPTICSTVNKRTCTFCNTIFYAEKPRYDLFKKHYTLLDGDCCCSNCCVEGKELYAKGSYYRMLFDIESPKGTKGKLFAKVNGYGGGFIAPEDGGNVFTCQNCYKIFYYDSKKEFSCQVCGERLCHSCSLDTGKEKLESGEQICASCPTADSLQSPITKKAQNKGKKVFNCYKNDGLMTKVLDDSQNPLNLFHCAVCQKLTYHQTSSQSFNKCECCGRLIDKSCWNSLTPNPYLDIKLCKFCTSITESYSFIKEKNEVFKHIADNNTSKQNLISADVSYEYRFANMDEHMIKDICNYLNSKDRRAVLKALKKKSDLSKIYSLTIISVGAAGKGEKNNCAIFRLFFKKTCRHYTFVYHCGDLRLQSIS